MKKITEKCCLLPRSIIVATSLLTCIAIHAEHDKPLPGDRTENINDEQDNKVGTFIQKALRGGEMEVKMGELGQEKGQSQDVKNLSQMLITDHQKANQELRDLAKMKNVQLSENTPHKQDRMWSMLQSKTGADFDKAFVTHAIRDHKKDIAEFEHCSKKGSDPELKAFIDKTLPTLRNHLTMAQNAARSLGLSDASLSQADQSDGSAVGAPAESETGSYKDQSRPDSSNVSKDLNRQGSVDTDLENRYHTSDGAIQTDSSLTINKNTPAVTESSSSGSVSIAPSEPPVKHTFLGMNTSKDDGKLLGFIPWHKRHKDSEQSNESVGAPASNSQGSGSSYQK